MCVMEDSDFQVISDYEVSESAVNVTEIEDDRIPCTNNESLNKILQLAITKATNVAQSHTAEDSKSKFVARFTQVFSSTVRANVCVDGLPWSIEGLTNVEREQQEQETDDALLSRLSKQVERVARKRKVVAKECTRIREIRLKHQRQNLRKLTMETPVSSTPHPALPQLFPHEELAQICRDLNVAKTGVRRVANELPTLEKNFEMAQKILKRQAADLEDDTGYISS